MSCKQSEACWDDQPPAGSHLRDRGEHPLCEGVRLGGGDGDHHQEHQAVRHQSTQLYHKSSLQLFSVILIPKYT